MSFEEQIEITKRVIDFIMTGGDPSDICLEELLVAVISISANPGNLISDYIEQKNASIGGGAKMEQKLRKF